MIRLLPCARLLVLAFLTIPLPASGQDRQAPSLTTRLIPYTAVLPDAGLDAIAGPRAITFALFDEAEGGTRLWSEAQTVRVDARGRYTAHLGAVTALPLEIFRSEQARWLEVTVDGAALPRTMLVAVPYALRAADAETLGGRGLSEFVLTDRDGRRVRADGMTIDDPTVDGTGVPNQIAKWSTATALSSSILTESFDNRLGVLAPDPTGGGVVDARFTIRNPDNNTAISVLTTSNQRRFALNTSVTGGFTFYDGGSSTWNRGLTQWEGKIGVGTILPVSTLDVRSDGSFAVRGLGSGGARGLEGQSDSDAGVIGFSATGDGGIVGVSGGTALAGRFNGNVNVTGTLTKGGGAFQIDHPLDPASKYLRHSFVESPDMLNVYNGNVTLDGNGEAWVTLPEWFEALNRDFRYQLTAIGAPGPSLHIASKVSGNRFKIAGGATGAEVSWQVTGIRQDAWANAHRIVVEEQKPADERGFYLAPAAFGLPDTMAVPSQRVRPSRAGGQ